MTATEAPHTIDDADWPTWLAAILPGYCTAPFARHHRDYWEWLWRIERGERPEAFVGIWPRGGAKSTSAEAGCVVLGARGVRRYGLYVCETQEQADKHVATIASMLESERVALFYPEVGERQVGKYGNSRGWRRNRLWTASGFVIDALGLDSASRGVKVEEKRPDLLVIDDVDGRHDSPAATRKKVETLTESVIPTGSDDVAILAIQNLILRGGVFDQLATGKADYLRRRKVSGPIPAVEGLEIERADDGTDRIVAGRATWAGQPLERCEEQINDWGWPAFRREAQHDVAEAEGALWASGQIDRAHVEEFPDLDALVVSVDPSGGKGVGHDEQGIVAVGRCGTEGYVIDDQTCSLSPMGWGKRAVRLAVDLSADRIIVEDNYGGEMTTNTIRVAADALVAEGLTEAAKFDSAHPAGVVPRNAKSSKKYRAEPVAALYGEKERPVTWADGRMSHVGRFPELEAEMCSWEPDTTTKSPNRVDALVHAVTDLGLVAPRGRKLRAR